MKCARCGGPQVFGERCSWCDGAEAPRTCGGCGHYVRLHGAARSHRCDIQGSVTWPEREACGRWTRADAARVHVPARADAETAGKAYSETVAEELT